MGFLVADRPNPNFIVYFNEVELANVRFTCLNPTAYGTYAVPAAGIRAFFGNCEATSYQSDGITLAYRQRIDDGQNVLATGTIDLAAITLPAFPQSYSSSSRGYSFNVANGGLWGSETSGVPRVLDDQISAALVLDATASGSASASATSNTFPLPGDGRVLVFRAYCLTSGTGSVRIRLYWSDLTGTFNSQDLFAGTTAAFVGTRYFPTMLAVVPPAEAMLAQIYFEATNGAALKVCNPTLR